MVQLPRSGCETVVGTAPAAAGHFGALCSSAQPPRNLKDFFERIEFLYPVAKSEMHSFDCSLSTRSPIGGLGVRMRLRRLRVLFKGGLFLRFYQTPSDGAVQRAFFTHTRHLYPSRAFVWTEDARFRICLGHVETGFMAELDPLDEDRGFQRPNYWVHRCHS